MNTAMTVRSANDGRAQSTSSPDLRSFSDLLRTIVRYAPVIVVAALLSGGVAAVLQRASDSATTAKARVVLTNRVVWPYYDAVRDAQVEIVAEQQTFDEVAKRIADVGTLEKLTTSVPTGQAFVDIEATASSTAAAVAAANAAADYLTEISKAETAAESQTKLDLAKKDLAEIEANITAMSDQLSGIEQRIAALQVAIAVPNPSQANLAEVRQLENQRSALLDRRNAESSRRSQALFNADQANTELRNSAGRVEVLRRAYEGANDPSRSKAVLALAALVGAFLAALAAVGYDATYQRIRSRRHAQQGAARGLHVLDPEELRSESAYVNRLLEVRQGDEVIGVASGFTSTAVSGRAVSAISGALTAARASVVSFGEAVAAPSTAVHVPLRTILERDAASIDAACADIERIIVERGHVHIGIDDYLKKGGLVGHSDAFQKLLHAARRTADVVVMDCGVTDEASTRWRALGGLCGVMVIVVEAGRTRQSHLRGAIATASERPVREIVVSLGVPHVVVAHPVATTADA